MITSNDVITELRSWIGTPVISSGAVKGRGCNCMGLAGGVARNLGLQELWAAFEPYQGHAHPPARRFLIRGLSRRLKKTDEIRPGCLLLLREGEDPTHVALVTRKNANGVVVIEAIGARVSEHQLDPKRQILASFEVPGVQYV